MRSIRPAVIVLALVVSACGEGAASPTVVSPTNTVGPPDSTSSAGGLDDAAIAAFYSGKTVRILVGSPPGGGFDTYARTLAKYLPLYIPGSPNVVVENAEGRAGELLVANGVFNTEPQDGTVIGTFAEAAILEAVLGGDGVRYDPRQFNWLGAATKGVFGCIARNDSGVTSIEALIDGSEEMTIGTAGPGSDLYGVPNIIKNALGANMRLVSGYGGFPDLLLATESGEVDGFCATFEVVVSRASSLVGGENPVANFIVVTGETVPAHPSLNGVPAWQDLADDEETKAVLRVSDAPKEVSKPYTFGPMVPPDRVEAMRRAFAEAFADPKLIEELSAAGLSVDFTAGADVNQIVDGIYAAPESVLESIRELTE